LLFSPSIQEQIFRANVTGYFQHLKQEVNNRAATLIGKGELVDDAVTRRIVHDLISEQKQRFANLPRLQGADVTFEQAFSSRHAQTIDEIRRSVFQDLPITEGDTNNLVEVVAAYYSKDYFGPGASGVVIAGFGTDDVFPSLVHFAVENLLDAHLKWKEIETATIDHFTNNATIIPFAQREMVDTFLSGVDPTYKQTVLQAFDGILRASVEELVAVIPDSALPNKAQLITTLTQRFPQLITTFNRSLDDYSRNRHISPILNAVAALPKDDLAAMAESLVNLTSFKRRISTDAETVGGQIDVAVISKGDGFIWIKRKHYFDAGRNPHFIANYYRDDTT